MREVSFGRRYWIVMVLYVEIYLLSRYIYFLILEDHIGENSFVWNLLEFIGVS